MKNQNKPSPTQDKVFEEACEIARQFGTFRRRELITRVRTLYPQLSVATISNSLYNLLEKGKIARGNRNCFRVPGVFKETAKQRAKDSGRPKVEQPQQQSGLSANIWAMIRRVFSASTQDGVKSTTGKADGVTVKVGRTKAV